MLRIIERRISNVAANRLELHMTCDGWKLESLCRNVPSQLKLVLSTSLSGCGPVLKYHSSPALLLSLPIVGLSLITLTTTMHPEQRFQTAASFALLAMSRYLLAAETSGWLMVLGYILVILGNLLYCRSFSSQIRVWSTQLSVATSVYFLLLFYYSFSDLFVSIPFLVLLLAAALASSCITVVAAGSVCQYGLVADSDSDQASYIRLVGAIANAAGSSFFIINLFNQRTETLQVLSRVMFYVAQGLLFFANERTF